MLRRLKNTIIYLLARLLMGLMRRLSWSRSLGFGRWLGRLAFGFAKEARRTTLENLARAFPEKTVPEREVLALEAFEHFGMAAAECINIRRLRDLPGYLELQPRSRRVLDDLLSRGRGVVLVTGHFGNWELLGRALARLGYPINTIGRKSYDARFTRLIERFRRQGAVRTIWRGEPKVMERMEAVLRRGEVMGLLIDQDTQVPGAFVPFFGRLAYTPTAAAWLMRQAGAPAVCIFNHRRGSPEGGYRVEIEEFTPCDLADFEQAVVEDTRRLTARLEAHILLHPGEWVWMHRRFKTRPGEP